jgi:hypothetical protein
MRRSRPTTGSTGRPGVVSLTDAGDADLEDDAGDEPEPELEGDAFADVDPEIAEQVAAADAEDEDVDDDPDADDGGGADLEDDSDGAGRPDDDGLSDGCFVSPAILADLDHDHQAVQEEIIGRTKPRWTSRPNTSGSTPTTNWFRDSRSGSTSSRAGPRTGPTARGAREASRRSGDRSEPREPSVPGAFEPFDPIFPEQSPNLTLPTTPPEDTY